MPNMVAPAPISAASHSRSPGEGAKGRLCQGRSKRTVIAAPLRPARRAAVAQIQPPLNREEMEVEAGGEQAPDALRRA